MKRSTLLTTIAIALAVIVPLVFSLVKLTHGSLSDFFNTVSQREVPKGQLLPDPVSKNYADERKLKVAQELAARVEKNGSMPVQSLLGGGQLTGDSTMEELLQTLAVELQSSEILGLIRTYQENSRAIAKATIESAAAQAAIAGTSGNATTPAPESSPDPAAKAIEENALLISNLREAFARNGIQLTEAQVASLCSSPNADDIVALAASFASISAITQKIQDVVRQQPTPELARKYYGTYTVLLVALDKIQRNAIEKIRNKHIPRVRELITQATQTKEEAEALKFDPNASQHAKKALQANIKRCDETIAQGRTTEAALLEQAAKLRSANEKLGFSIAMATNTHKTLTLQRELAELIAACQAEIEALQSLSLPSMLIINVDSTRPAAGFSPGSPQN